jgi:hypothetical protein
MINHPLRNAEVFSHVRSANLNFFFNKSAYLKSQHLGFCFKTCVLKNIRLDNVGQTVPFSRFVLKTHSFFVRPSQVTTLFPVRE